MKLKQDILVMKNTEKPPGTPRIPGRKSKEKELTISNSFDVLANSFPLDASAELSVVPMEKNTHNSVHNKELTVAEFNRENIEDHSDQHDSSTQSDNESASDQKGFSGAQFTWCNNWGTPNPYGRGWTDYCIMKDG